MHVRWRGFELPSSVQVDRATLTDTYGRFVAEPFERGFGATVGNSLRRVLLSSLEGSAVTQIKIRGAQHEFTTSKARVVFHGWFTGLLASQVKQNTTATVALKFTRIVRLSGRRPHSLRQDLVISPRLIADIRACVHPDLDRLRQGQVRDGDP